MAGCIPVVYQIPSIIYHNEPDNLYKKPDWLIRRRRIAQGIGKAVSKSVFIAVLCSGLSVSPRAQAVGANDGGPVAGATAGATKRP